MAADRHLLFGLVALQNGLINQGQLVAAFQAWTLDKSRRLSEHLEARGDLTSAKRALLEALAEVHAEAHGGEAEKSIAAVPAGKSTRERLASQRAVSPRSSILRAGHRCLVSSVRRLGGKPVLPPDRFDERKVERRGGSDVSESALDHRLDRGRCHRPVRRRGRERQEERLRDCKTGRGQCLLDNSYIRAEAVLERRLESNTAADTGQGRA